MRNMTRAVFIAPSADACLALVDKLSITHAWFSELPDGRVIVSSYHQHAHTALSMGQEESVTVLPSPHDPAPIGDLHEHLTHIEARPEHTPRQVYLRLHEKHGPQFHPDV